MSWPMQPFCTGPALGPEHRLLENLECRSARDAVVRECRQNLVMAMTSRVLDPISRGHCTRRNELSTIEHDPHQRCVQLECG
jgi:hypothetical protein